MDAFGDNFVNEQEVDPVTEFVAREQDQLAGLEYEIPAVAMSAPTTASNNDEKMDAFGDSFVNEQEVDPVAEFVAREQDQLAGLEYEIPAVAMSTPTTVSNNDDVREHHFGDSASKPPPIKEEPEKIRKWREEQKARLEEKDAEEEKKKEEWSEAARKELEEWYKHHAEAISKTKTTNRESAKNAEKQFVAEADEVEPGTEWERIAKLCDFNPKSSRTSKDVSRMRSIIVQLKQTPAAPVSL